jgi:hypothetical protein
MPLHKNAIKYHTLRAGNVHSENGPNFKQLRRILIQQAVIYIKLTEIIIISVSFTFPLAIQKVRICI